MRAWTVALLALSLALTTVGPAVAQGPAPASGDPHHPAAPSAQSPVPPTPPATGMAPGAAAPCAPMGAQGPGVTGGMMPMMGMMAQMMSNPKMMEMHGEMLRAMGDIMMKYGKTMQGAGR